MFVLGLYCYYTFNHGVVNTLIINQYTLIATVVVLSYLMVAELPLFSLKGNPFNYKENNIRFIFLILCIPQIIIFKWLSMPTIILCYVLFSIIDNNRNKQNA
ncbi:MAG: hypothetical protein IPK18_08725 [Sphingobacteriales bacterium]|nr:MAG: hypothetical protein IPK18_08725 [Sphingobacteriales bacterium]